MTEERFIPRARSYAAFEEDSIRGFAGERALWAAVVRRTLADAKGFRLGTDTDISHNYVQRQARKWFRSRSKHIGGWGWIVDSIDIPPWEAERIEAEAALDGHTKDFELLAGAE